MLLEKACPVCERPFWVKPSRADRRCCSIDCRRAWERDLDRRIECAASGCWLWLGQLSDDGYPRIKIDGVTQAAHRLMYERRRGKIAEGLTLDHLCRTRACVNPDHLEPVTQAENYGRAPSVIAARAATACPKGHEFVPSNIYINPASGQRFCRQCRAAGRHPGREP